MCSSLRCTVCLFCLWSKGMVEVLAENYHNIWAKKKKSDLGSRGDSLMKSIILPLYILIHTKQGERQYVLVCLCVWVDGCKVRPLECFYMPVSIWMCLTRWSWLNRFSWEVHPLHVTSHRRSADTHGSLTLIEYWLVCGLRWRNTPSAGALRHADSQGEGPWSREGAGPFPLSANQWIQHHKVNKYFTGCVPEYIIMLMSSRNFTLLDNCNVWYV